MNRVVTIILVAVVMSTMLTAQQATLTFEVASVRPNVSDTPPSMTVPRQGTVAITNVPLINIITNAYAAAVPNRGPLELVHRAALHPHAIA